MLDIQSQTRQCQAKLLGIPSSSMSGAPAAFKSRLDVASIQERLIERGYDRKILDHLVESFAQETQISRVDVLDVWVHVTHYLALAEIVFADPAKAAHWLQRETVHIDGASESPLMMLATPGGAYQVEERLQQIRHGLHA